MKNITYLFILLLTYQIGLSQNGSRIKALKTAHITNALNLTADEAEKFWPIYNAADVNIKKYRMQLRQITRKSKEDLSEGEAKILINQYIDTENKLHKEEINLLTQLKGVLSAKKIIKLKKAEEDFNRKVLEQMKKRRMQGERPNRN
ncbi:MAG: sensor of ECF-type sigma factor [Flavobacteriaceae bacterium]|nr:sensor of ECF-type sigma factor [Flavobacteriaceae bacterium]